MNKIITLLLFVVSAALFANTPRSSSDYTYRRDLKVSNIYQLTNQTIVPQEVVEGVNSTSVDAGEVRILVGSDMVAFKGIDGLTAFGIISKTKTAYGFELKLIDSRGTDFSKLAIETDGDNYIENLYFESKRYGDFQFKLPQKSTEQIQKEKNYYTASTAYKIFAYSDLTSKSLKPYKRVNLNNTTLREEKIVIEEKLSFDFKAKNITINTGNQSKTLNVKKTSVGLEKLNGKEQKVLRIKTNKRAQNFSIYLDDKNQINAIKTNNTQYFFR